MYYISDYPEWERLFKLIIIFQICTQNSQHTVLRRRGLFAIAFSILQNCEKPTCLLTVLMHIVRKSFEQFEIFQSNNQWIWARDGVKSLKNYLARAWVRVYACAHLRMHACLHACIYHRRISMLLPYIPTLSLSPMHSWITICTLLHSQLWSLLICTDS